MGELSEDTAAGKHRGFVARDFTFDGVSDLVHFCHHLGRHSR